jgi:uncharacterized protein (TIGR03085 family)
MGWVTQEKQALVETLRTADPDADTLCAGWDVRRLLAHLVQREQAPLPSLTDAVARKPPGDEPGLTRLTEAAATPTGYQDLVSRFVAGPPRWSPMSWAAEKINLVEYVIHHEDIRRGGADPAAPRTLPAGQSKAVWDQLGVFARLSLRSAPGGVRLATPDGASRTVKKGAGVTLTGDPAELALFVSGRRAAARVEITGSESAVAAFTAQT